MVVPTLDLENKLWEEGYAFVVGADEVGRGPLAGPLVVGAVVVGKGCKMIDGVRDSKKLSEKRREELCSEIKSSVIGWGIGEVSSDELDSVGITKSVNIAMSRAVESLIALVSRTNIDFRPQVLIIDGKGVMDHEGYKCIKMNKGDLNHYSIACASIIAKVYRDTLMKEYATQYPEYGFDEHMGYGTKKHIDTINSIGICPIHRRSFAPIKNLVVNI